MDEDFLDTDAYWDALVKHQVKSMALQMTAQGVQGNYTIEVGRDSNGRRMRNITMVCDTMVDYMRMTFMHGVYEVASSLRQQWFIALINLGPIQRSISPLTTQSYISRLTPFINSYPGHSNVSGVIHSLNVDWVLDWIQEHPHMGI